jgi:hypothetical protein
MTMRSTILILAVALVTSGCMHDPINALFAMFLLIVFAFGLGIDRSAEEIRNRSNTKGCKYYEYYCAQCDK